MFPRFLATICTVLFCLDAVALAQAPSGEISGVVTDASGAPMPGVTITLTNQIAMPMSIHGSHVRGLRATARNGSENSTISKAWNWKNRKNLNWLPCQCARRFW